MMPKKECNNGTWGRGTPVPHSFCIPASSHTIPKGIAEPTLLTFGTSWTQKVFAGLPGKSGLLTLSLLSPGLVVLCLLILMAVSCRLGVCSRDGSDNSSLDTLKNNSNSGFKGLKELIEGLEIKFISVNDFNRKWLQTSKGKLSSWYIENLKKVLRKQRELEEKYMATLPIFRLDLDDILTDLASTPDEIQDALRKLEEEDKIIQQNFNSLPAYQELQDAKRKIEAEELDILEYALNEFDKYLEKSEKRYKEFKSVREKKRVLSHAEHRFTRSYQQKVKVALRSLFRNELWDSRSVFLTLTLDPKNYSNRYQMWNNIKKEENRFLTGLFKKLGKRIPYISVIEAHKEEKSKGNPHIHILFLGVSRIMDWREIRDLWRLGHIWINRTGEGKKIKRPLAYMFKYITKTFCKTDGKNKFTQALVWLFHIRSYSTSRGLVKPLNKIESGEIEEYEIEGMLYTNKLTWNLECNLWDVIETLKNNYESTHDPG
jgi:Uncharacterized protein involved in chromosome partitioning